MAYLITIEGFYEIKVDQPVGAGRRALNNRDDVLVVQAMLKYAVANNPYFAYTNVFPIKGQMDNETILNIRNSSNSVGRSSTTGFRLTSQFWGRNSA